jgi:hypothetical protein
MTEIDEAYLDSVGARVGAILRGWISGVYQASSAVGSRRE